MPTSDAMMRGVTTVNSLKHSWTKARMIGQGNNRMRAQVCVKCGMGKRWVFDGRITHNWYRRPNEGRAFVNYAFTPVCKPVALWAWAA